LRHLEAFNSRSEKCVRKKFQGHDVVFSSQGHCTGSCKLGVISKKIEIQLLYTGDMRLAVEFEKVLEKLKIWRGSIMEVEGSGKMTVTSKTSSTSVASYIYILFCIFLSHIYVIFVAQSGVLYSLHVPVHYKYFKNLIII